MTKTKIGNTAIQIIKERKINYMGYENFGLLDDQ